MTIKNMMDLYVDQPQDMHSAERQLIKALPRMAKAAFSPDLRGAFMDHLTQTKEQLERLDGILASLDKTPGRKVCKAAQGLVEEGAEMIGEDADERGAGRRPDRSGPEGRALRDRVVWLPSDVRDLTRAK